MTLLALWFGCTGPTPTPTPTPTPPPVETGDTGPQHTGDTAIVEPPPVVDCTSIAPPGPLTFTQLEEPRAYHGLDFDDFGVLVGNNNTSMIQATAPDAATLWIPNTGGAEQMVYHPNGNLIVAGQNQGRIVSIDPAGQISVLASGINAYGVVIGPDGMVYTANQNVIHRIDPVNGGATVYLDSINTPKVLNFNKEGNLLYVGTNGQQGRVWEVDIDAEFNPVGPPRLLAQTGGSWHDGLGIDACGYLYINEYFTRSLYMVSPDGGSGRLINFNDIGSSAYAHGIAWGSGIGPWSDHHIYVPLPYGNNRVASIDLGRPSKDYNGGVYEVVR